MATHMHPPQLLYGASHYASATPSHYQQPCGSSFYYPHSRDSSASSFAGARDASAVTVVSNQVSKYRACYQSCISISLSYE